MSIEYVDLVLSMTRIDPLIFDRESLKSRLDLAEEITNREVKLTVDVETEQPLRDARGIYLLAQDHRKRWLLETGRSYWKNGAWVHKPKLKPQTCTETLKREPQQDPTVPEEYEDVDAAARRCKSEELGLADDVGTLYPPAVSIPYLDARVSSVYHRTKSRSIRTGRGLILPERLPKQFRAVCPVFEDTQKVLLHTQWFEEWPFPFPPFQPPFFQIDERLKNLDPLIQGLQL